MSTSSPPLTAVATDLWTMTGATVSFLTVPFTTRMTVVRLPDGSLLLHSPERFDGAVAAALDGLGEVRHLISPNKLHHLFLEPWLQAYPAARSYAAPGLMGKRPDLRFDAELTDTPEAAWADVVDQLVFRGSRVMEEVVFFHRPSRTLILTDLIENFEPAQLGWRQRWLARLAGIVAPDGKTPLDWRLTFWGGRAVARRCLAQMLAWAPERIVLAHGRCIERDASAFLRHSFRWLGGG